MLVLGLAHEESRSAFSGRRLDLQIVLRALVVPPSLREKSLFDQELGEVSVGIVVGNVGCLGAVPRLHVGVAWVHANFFTDGGFPIVAAK